MNRRQAKAQRSPPRRTPAPQLPTGMRKEISALARKLRKDYRALFVSDPLYRKRVGQFLTALLPPKPRRRGRPGIPSVTLAIKLLAKFRRENPGERAVDTWKKVYPLAIQNYEGMNEVEQRDARERLRERVRWRTRTVNRKS